ncbi:MAG: DUF308 domain-containing protein [Cyclobacteriaceae bacterium]
MVIASKSCIFIATMNILIGIILIALGLYTLFGSYWNKKVRSSFLLLEMGLVQVAFGVYAICV